MSDHDRQTSQTADKDGILIIVNAIDHARAFVDKLDSEFDVSMVLAAELNSEFVITDGVDVLLIYAETAAFLGNCVSRVNALRTPKPVIVILAAGADPNLAQDWNVHDVICDTEAPDRIASRIRGVINSARYFAKAGAQNRLLEEINGAIRPLFDAEEITLTAATMLGKYLAVNRCAYADVEADQDTFNLIDNYNNGVHSIVGRYKFAQFGAECLRLMRAGLPYVVEDSESDLRTDEVRDSYRATAIRSVICVPVIKGGRFVAAMAVHATAPRVWRDDEIKLLLEVANRCWESIARTRVTRDLRDNELRYRTLIENISSVVWQAEADGTLLKATPSWESFTGQTYDEYKDWGWMNAVHPDDREHLMAAWEKILREAAPASVEYRLRRHDGAYRYVISRAAPIFDQNGFIREWIGNCADISERFEAEHALKESESQLRQLANTIPQLAWIADDTGWIFWYNDRWYDYTGKTPADMEGWGWQSVHDPAILPSVVERWQASLSSGEPFAMTFPLLSKDGAFNPFYTLVAPLKDSSGKIVRWFGTNTDVSSLQKAEQALRESEERLQQGLLAGRMMVWDWDLRTQEIRLSSNAADIFGASWSNSSVGWSMIYEADVERFDSAVKRAIELRSECHEVVRMVRPDNGKMLWVDIRGKVICDACNEPYIIRGIALDVTERNRAVEDLKEANRRKDDFLAMLAHELRNPLAPISAAASLLKVSMNDEKRLKQVSEIISRQVRHITDLVDDLLDVSRVTRGLVELDKQHVDMKSIIGSAIEQARPLIESRRHQLHTRLDSDPAFVCGDRTRLIQVIANLLNNAAKYTQQGGIITLEVETAASCVNVRVKDNGAGIDPALLPHIFDLFTQGERTPDRSQGGLGLGLALVKNMVALHEGTVEAHSDGPGKGSTFTVTLPKLSMQDLELADEPVREIAIREVRSISIMIVDDNVDAARSLAALLEAAGHVVSVKEDAGSALEDAARNAHELFILDIGLPDLTGYELARRLRAQEKTADTIMIALTGYGQPHDRVLSKNAGFNYHFVKPIRTEDLERILSCFSVPRSVKRLEMRSNFYNL